MTVSGAGSAPARSRIARSLADCTVKLPEICPAPPGIGSRMTGAEITLLSSTIANGLPTFCWVASANLRAPVELKRKLTIGSPLRWSKPGCASIRSPPETSTRFSMRYFCAALAVENFRIRRRMRRQRLLRRHRQVDHAEIELRGLAENLLQPRRVLQARHLHQNAVGALALDRRLDQAELVDAALDDLDRLIDGLADALGDRRRRTGSA